LISKETARDTSHETRAARLCDATKEGAIMMKLAIYAATLVSSASLVIACGGGGAMPEPASPESTAENSAASPASETAATASNIVETATAAGSFTTLVAAVKAAGLAETLSGPGPFTVFAPTDDAFAKLPAGTVEGLLKPENKDKLVAILTYHVVPGVLMAKDVVGGSKLMTVQGQELSLSIDGSNVMVDDAKISKTDIAASNGVIHVIDNVVMPK